MELGAAFLDKGLIDEVRTILVPILIGDGATVFQGFAQRNPLRLVSTRAFRSGNLLAVYETAR